MISLCIISRKEDEENLKKAISSCLEYVDEIIIADTGKKPITLDNLVIYTDDYYAYSQVREEIYRKTKIIPFTWTGSFADARNFSFEQAKGDVIFWIDSDDIVEHPENLPKLAKLIEDGEADWIYSKYNYHKDEWGNVDAVHWKPRLFRKGSVKWVGAVHEDTVPTEGVIQVKDIETGVSPIVIEHQADTDHHEESAKRNLSILLAEYEKDKENTDPRIFQYLGITFHGIENYEDALFFLKKHINTTGSTSDKFWSLHLVAGTLHHLGDSRNAISVCMDALKLYPGWKTAYFDLASIYYDLGDWEKVIEWSLIGFDKDTPDILDVISEIDYTILPMARLCEAYMYLTSFKLAFEVASDMMKINPKMPIVKERYEACKEALELEKYVSSFLNVAQNFKKYDRVKTAKLFDLIPKELDDDVRIQQARNMLVPPQVWVDKTIAIYCGDSTEEWAYPSIFKGIGGSEEAVINMSLQLVRKGYKVVVYNRCGSLKGTYEGVEYKPYYHFNLKDNFNILIGWRCPGLFMGKIEAKKKYLWLHDILYPEQINKQIIDNVDKILFLSKWHSKNIKIPKEKIFITNNGINPDDFKDKPEKKSNSLIWSSSYDRGLLPFIKNIYPLVKQKVPEVTLTVAYGWQNILKDMKNIPELEKLYTELSPILENTPDIIHLSRISHLKLAKLMQESMIYPYASEFGETNNITSQKCQASGCFVITTSQAGGTPERVKFGSVIEGDNIYTDLGLQRLFADKIIEKLKNPTLIAESARKEIISSFSWEKTTKQWIKFLL